jgi:uncharacterized membrane protein
MLAGANVKWIHHAPDNAQKKCDGAIAVFAIGFPLSFGTLEESSLLDTGQNIYLIVLWVVLSITCLVLLNTLWEPTHRSVHNDVIGWQIAILGTIYAVMIGFMLYAVWTNFQTAETNANNEANNLVNLFRAADGLPQPQRDLIQQSARNYAYEVITQEWPEMHRAQSGSTSEPYGGQEYVMKLWMTTTQTSTDTLAQQASLRQVMIELSSMTEHRRVRLLESRTEMPTILWTVLVVGGMITIASSCLIGSENVVLHFVLIVALSLLVSLALVAIGDIDRPFQGSVNVSSYAFQQAQETMIRPYTASK